MILVGGTMKISLFRIVLLLLGFAILTVLLVKPTATGSLEPENKKVTITIIKDEIDRSLFVID